MGQQVVNFHNLSTEEKLYGLFNYLISVNAIQDFDIIHSPPDETFLFLYSCMLKTSTSKQQVSGTGVSVYTREAALLKCLAEATERYSLCINNETDIEYLNIVDKKINRSICCDIRERSSLDVIPGWVKGYNLSQSKDAVIPAQLVYLDYQPVKNEKYISQPISTGAAFGDSHEDTLLRGIYELVERDAFLTIYLNQINAPLIRLSGFGGRSIRLLIKKIERFNLEVKLFDIKNDLNIPAFLCVIIDKTGLGPSCALGLKASLNHYEAISGAIEEALHIRLWVRGRMVKNQFKGMAVSSKKIKNQEDRMMYWAPVHQLSKLGFLLNQKSVAMSFEHYAFSKEDELKDILTTLKKRGHDVYYVDTTLRSIKHMGAFTYKVIIPTLQAFYMNENFKKINNDRINKVANYFNKKTISQNTAPHPFL